MELFPPKRIGLPPEPPEIKRPFDRRLVLDSLAREVRRDLSITRATIADLPAARKILGK